MQFDESKVAWTACTAMECYICKGDLSLCAMRVKLVSTPLNQRAHALLAQRRIAARARRISSTAMRAVQVSNSMNRRAHAPLGQRRMAGHATDGRTCSERLGKCDSKLGFPFDAAQDACTVCTVTDSLTCNEDLSKRDSCMRGFQFDETQITRRPRPS